MMQCDCSALIDLAYQRIGFRGGASVQVGEFTALPHGSMTPQTIQEGTPVMIDDGCDVEGYKSDITRTFVIGKPTDKMKRCFDLVHQAQQAAYEAARVGNECQAVDAAARKVITDGGFGPDYKYFAHRLGHGIGMDGHEWPYLVRGNTLKLQPNMTFSDEPGIYIPGEFGMRLEDDNRIMPEGPSQLFTPQSPSLERPFATAFVRPGRFRFQFTDTGLGDRSSRYIVWADGNEVLSWWDAKPGVRHPGALQDALAPAAGISGGSGAGGRDCGKATGGNAARAWARHACRLRLASSP